MKTLGIITEYNPFHDGHAYQIAHAKEMTGTTQAVVVMSGNFVQRGEPAIISKWARTKGALLNGVDLVVELPFAYAALSAELFAHAGISLLHSMGIVDIVVFGSESGVITQLDEIAEQLIHPSQQFTDALKNNLSLGHSFPASRENAILQTLSLSHAQAIHKPNNILGIEYLKAAKKINTSFRLMAIKRVGAGYHDKDHSNEYPSATALREEIMKGCIPDNGLPISVQKILNEEITVTYDQFSDMIIANLRRLSPSQLSEYTDVSEGLENRIIEMAGRFHKVSEIISHTVTKRYTASRISRILLHVCMGYTKKDLGLFGPNPPYIRILGANQIGFKMIKEMKNTSSLPIVMNMKYLRYHDSKSISRMVRLECIATDLYMLCSKGSSGKEFSTNPIILP